jgi:hypothetical protein
VVLASYYEDVLDSGAPSDTTQAELYADRTGARVVVADSTGISLLDTDAVVGRNFSTRPEVAKALGGSAGLGHSALQAR